MTRIPRIRRLGAMTTAAVVLALLSLAGCLNDVPEEPMGVHSATWNTVGETGFHGTKVVEEGPDDCLACHGDDLHGGPGDAAGCFECHDGPSGHPIGFSSEAHADLANMNGKGKCKKCHDIGGDEDDADGDGDPHDGWAQTSCQDCHSPIEVHPAGWSASEQHGSYVTQNTAQECKSCHGGNFRGGKSGVSCYQCHDGPDGGGGDGGPYHPTGWSSPSLHGAEVVNNGADSCTSCHGNDYLGGSSGVSCYTCHDGPDGGNTGPYHPTGWSSPSLHGAEVEANGTTDCASCHASDFTGGNTGVSCYTCHDGPGGHPTGWSSPSQHGATAALDDAASCATCHGANFDGGWSSVSCYTCHDGPGGGSQPVHPVGWSDPSQHGTEVVANSPTDCASCHGADFTGGNSGVSCFTCHNGPSGHPPNWNYPSQHGTEVVANSANDCQACHGPNYQGGWSGQSCFTCHDGPGGHPTGWSSPSQHGATAVLDDAASCATCHGANFDGGWSSVSCYTCHDGPTGGSGSPHPVGWSSSSQHGAEVVANSAESCTSCHGADYQGGTSGVSCYTCHDGPGGHPSTWRSGHRSYTRNNGPDECRACHGNDYRGGWSGVSCYQCHSGPNG